MLGRKNLKKLQISPKYKKGYHIYIQQQSRITTKNWDYHGKNWDYQEQTEISEKSGLPEKVRD